MDYYTILAQRQLLAHDILGQHVVTLVRAGAYTLFIAFDNGCALKLASTPDMPYLVYIDPRFIPRKKARSWHQSRVESRVLRDISIVPGDRVLTFLFDGGTRLIFELTGRHANVIITDPEGIIAGSLRQVTGKESGIRTICSGRPYEPPPSRPYVDLSHDMLPDIAQRFQNEHDVVGTVIRKTLACGSRYFAAEVCARADISPDMPVPELTESRMNDLLTTVIDLARGIEQGGDCGSIIFRKDGLPQDVFPVSMTAPDIAATEYDSLNEAIRIYARDREIELERRSLKAGIISALANEERRIRKTIAKVEHERGDAESSDELERRANTILANLYNIKRGSTTVTLTDVYDGTEVVIELDPSLDAAENAQRLFKRARKRRAAAKLATERLESLRNHLSGIEHDREAVESVTDIRDLQELAKKHTREQQFRRDSGDDDVLFPRRFVSPSGLDIIVGRNDRENDELVRWARKQDLWLHAQYIGGSHVVLRSPGKQVPDRKSVERAAAIAAYYSKARTSGIVPVVCTQIKYVTKRKGQGPGKVTYTREQVLFVEPGKF